MRAFKIIFWVFFSFLPLLAVAQEDEGDPANDQNSNPPTGQTDSTESVPDTSNFAHPGLGNPCSSYWIGTFRYITKGGRDIKFRRKRKKQIETNQVTGQKTVYKVKWETSCDYTLTFKKSTEETKLDKGWTKEVKIVGTYKEFYKYESDQYGIINKGIIQKILSKGQIRRKRRKEAREQRRKEKEEARKLKEEQERMEEEELERRIAEYDEFNDYDPEIAKIIEERKKEAEKEELKAKDKAAREEAEAAKKEEKNADKNKTKEEKKAEKKRKKEAKKNKPKKENVFTRLYDKTLGKLISKFFRKKPKNKVEGEIREIDGG